ncbi:MAG: hypothetical protein K2R98_29190 [Gemmataceae bacterium]|nr:hypothetical protein [Gemmataceae bacterium]
MHRSVLLVTLLLITATAHGGVGDPTLETNHPQYAGEGAFQTIEDCVKHATAGKTTPQDKAIAMYLWMLTHQFHLHSPQEWCVPGTVPNAAKDNQEMVVYDAERSRFSYGYGLCGTVHAWNEPYWKALGMNARRRAFPGHTNSEIEYGGSWHTFDTDMAGLVFRKDGVVAGYEDIIKDLSCLDVNKSPVPQYPFAWPGDFNGMKDGWKQVAKGGNWFKMYNAGYAAQPGIVQLRAGERFTRYFDRDHFGGPDKRRFWHSQKGGPFRDWTFVNMGAPEHNGAKSNSRGNASYCNGEFIYKPNLAAATYKEGVAEQSATVLQGDASPCLRSKDGGAATVTVQHFSPYVIAGCPADGANPMSGPATGGLVVSGETVGTVTLEVSADQGQTWKPAGDVSGKFEKDLTNDVKGYYGWHVRFGWKGPGGIDALSFTTVTQVAQTIYPRLRPEGSTVIYRSATRGVVPVLPNFSQPENVIARYEEKGQRSANVAYAGRGPKSRFAYNVQGNKPGSVVFRVDTPAELLRVTAAARYNIRVPPPDNCDFHLDVSTDGGKTWKLMSKADVPKDNEYSSGYVYGAADVSAAKVNSALVRVTVYQGGYQVGLMTAELYGVYQTPKPQPMKLTYAWKESGQLKTHVENIADGAREHKFQVPTGKTIVDEFVRMEVP